MSIKGFSSRLLGPVEVRRLAQEIGIIPTKSLGQNFVLDPGTVRKIVEISQVRSGDAVVEIGPGLGSLTLALIEVDADVTVVEIDSGLVRKLPDTIECFAPGKQIRIIHKDALKIIPEDIIAGDKSAWLPEFLIANLPYNISVPVLLHFLTLFPSIRKVVVMVQKEVADRLAATPGNKVYGIPSVKAQYFGRVSRGKTIHAQVFWPQPHIDSALVVIDRHENPPWPMDMVFQRRLFSIIDTAFATRRKMLRQSLTAWAGSAHQAQEYLQAAGIDPQRRAETLTIDDFVRLALL